MQENTDLNLTFENKIREIFAAKKLPKKIAVAVSGGCDSLALTFLLASFCQKNNIKLFAFTVDHKMRQGSKTEALQLNKLLLDFAINHEISEISSDSVPQKNIEANLRKLRYELLISLCKKHKITHLFLGHQMEDVAENFLIRLFRGSGLDGLAAISENSLVDKINILRPLLRFSKQDLKEFLQQKNITWFEDESNSDEKFLRNKIRAFLNDFSDAEIINERIKNAADEIALTRNIFDKKVLFWAKKILRFEKSFFVIDVKNLAKVEEKIALKILAFAAMEVAQNEYKPRLKDLLKFYEYLLANESCKRRDFYGCTAFVIDENLVQLRSQEMLKNGEEKNLVLKTILQKVF